MATSDRECDDNGSHHVSGGDRVGLGHQKGKPVSLLTVREVCEELGITSSTWDKWRARRVGPPTIVLPNGSLRVRRSELEHWLLDREVA